MEIPLVIQTYRGSFSFGNKIGKSLKNHLEASQMPNRQVKYKDLVI